MAVVKFRSALNGFNRQDVVDYIERASKRLQTVKDERDKLRHSLDEALRAAANKTAETSENAELEKLRYDYDVLYAVAEQLQKENRELTGKCTALQSEIATLTQEKTELAEDLHNRTASTGNALNEARLELTKLSEKNISLTAELERITNGRNILLGMVKDIKNVCDSLK